MEHDFRFHHGRRTGHRRSRRKPARTPFGFQVAAASVIVALAVWNATPAINSVQALATMSEADLEKIERSAYYPNCRAARAAGAAPMDRGSPGYRPELDGDDDGTACEPYRY